MSETHGQPKVQRILTEMVRSAELHGDDDDALMWLVMKLALARGETTPQKVLNAIFGECSDDDCPGREAPMIRDGEWVGAKCSECGRRWWFQTPLPAELASTKEELASVERHA